jgi:multiple sugar transport system permease protein
MEGLRPIRARESTRRRSNWSWYLLLLPLFAILVVVEVYPLAYSLYFSLTNHNTGAFIGLANYSQEFTTAAFYGSLLTSLVYSTASTIIALVAGILLAFQLSQFTKRRWLLESVLLAPLAVSPLVVGVIFAPAGVWDDVNAFWHFILGQPFFNVLAYSFFFPVMVLSESWEWAPIIMLVTLGIMSSIPPDLYEAASAHGGSTWQTFRRVVLPTVLRSPAMHFVIIVRFIDAMRAFEVPFTWASWVGFSAAGSPVDTLSLYVFKLLFAQPGSFPIGYVSAVAITLVAITLGVTTALFRLFGRTVKT